MNIVVIDDEAGVRRTVSMILEDEGYDVTTASNGREGLAQALDCSADIVICDVKMPEMDGLEFLEAYQDEGGDGLVVTMTAYGGVDMALEAMKRGAYDYIAKPFSADSILLTLRKAEEREKLRREVGQLRNAELSRYWAQVVASREGRHLSLRSHGRELAVGRHRSDEQRLQLARDLARELRQGAQGARVLRVVHSNRVGEA